MKPALLVIDVQQEFFNISPATAESLNDAIGTINAALVLFRKKALPIICVQHMDKSENLVPGQPGFDLPASLEILPEDPHIHKVYGNAFNKTPLASMLSESGVDTVVITGFCAEYCVLSAYHGAMDIDLTPILLRGALASATPANIPFVESISDTISYGALAKFLE